FWENTWHGFWRRFAGGLDLLSVRPWVFPSTAHSLHPPARPPGISKSVARTEDRRCRSQIAHPTCDGRSPRADWETTLMTHSLAVSHNKENAERRAGPPIVANADDLGLSRSLNQGVVCML